MQVNLFSCWLDEQRVWWSWIEQSPPGLRLFYSLRGRQDWLQVTARPIAGHRFREGPERTLGRHPPLAELREVILVCTVGNATRTLDKKKRDVRD